MNARVIELAKECGIDLWYGTDDAEFINTLEAFYKAAYRDGEKAMRERSTKEAADIGAVVRWIE